MALKVAVVCSSNMNRSMESHHLLSKKGFDVKSYGIGAMVRLPGSSSSEPNCYSFQTTYEDIYQDLLRKDPQLNNLLTSHLTEIVAKSYTQNGILRMLDRNRRIKPHPERFQEINGDRFDLVFTVEERIYDVVVEELESRGSQCYCPTHIINLEVQDNQDEATLGAFLIYELCERLRSSKDLENEIEDILHYFELKHSRTILHSIVFS